jgi:hypothetical protein
MSQVGERVKKGPTSVPNQRESDRAELNRRVQRARRRAERRLAQIHPKEFEALFHEEKHIESYGHLHGPDNPETIGWWGSVTSSTPSQPPKVSRRNRDAQRTARPRERMKDR